LLDINQFNSTKTQQRQVMDNSKIRLCALLVLAQPLITACSTDEKQPLQQEQPTIPTPPVQEEPAPAKWQLVWSDEFDGESINQANWNMEVNCNGGGNNERQCYTDNADNAFVVDGKLNIVAKAAPEGAELPFTSARLNSKNKADFKYGRFEINAKLPTGQGAWPAIWMLPTDEAYGGWPRSGEIDIMEAVNLGVVDTNGVLMNQVHGTLHYGRAWPNNVYSGKDHTLADGASPSADFHVYAVEWEEGEIRWYVDDVLYATQRKSELRKNDAGVPVGLAHQGWFTSPATADGQAEQLVWDNAPFDQAFHLILNYAVGGNWPENTGVGGIDSSAIHENNVFQIDYVRVYECSVDAQTGKGCATTFEGYDEKDKTLIDGKAPAPVPPSQASENLTIFGTGSNPNWPAWDCCGGSTPTIEQDPQEGAVMRFTVGATPTVNGFISRSQFITDPNGQPSPFDASLLAEGGVFTFKMNMTQAPTDVTASWLLKIEANGGANFVEVNLSSSLEGKAPAQGQWQTYTFPIASLKNRGLDITSIDAVLIFPTWGLGAGASYDITNVDFKPAGISVSEELVLFDNSENTDWPTWDCCGGTKPSIEIDDEQHNQVAQFQVGSQPTVLGFATRTDLGGSNKPFNASNIEEAALQFEIKLVQAPKNSQAKWKVKLESNKAETAVELDFTESVEGVLPKTDAWQTVTFPMSMFQQRGLDITKIDVVLIFPAWGEGDGAMYRIDNAKITSLSKPQAATGMTLYREAIAPKWRLWDCCGGSTPTEEQDTEQHGMTAQFVIGAAPTVMGFYADDGVYYDATALRENGVVKFDLKVVTAPKSAEAKWLFKIESGDAATAVELSLAESQEAQNVLLNEWQRFTFPLKALAEKGLDLSKIDVLMVFPSWGLGEGAVYRIDNVSIDAVSIDVN
jgi:beta-glucanase (GH16 family)